MSKERLNISVNPEYWDVDFVLPNFNLNGLQRF